MTARMNELGKCVHEEIRYVWLDESGDECSPLHAKFHTALRFHEMHFERSSRRERAEAKLRRQWGDDYEVSPIRYPPPQTKTGKPPVKLERRVIRTYQSDLMPAQQAVLDSYLEESAA